MSKRLQGHLTTCMSVCVSVCMSVCALQSSCHPHVSRRALTGRQLSSHCCMCVCLYMYVWLSVCVCLYTYVCVCLYTSVCMSVCALQSSRHPHVSRPALTGRPPSSHCSVHYIRCFRATAVPSPSCWRLKPVARSFTTVTLHRDNTST